MENALKCNELRRNCVHQTFKIEIQRGNQINQTFCKISSPQKLGPHYLIARNFKTLRNVLLNDAECIEI